MPRCRSLWLALAAVIALTSPGLAPIAAHDIEPGPADVISLGNTGLVDDWAVSVVDVIPDAEVLLRRIQPGTYVPPEPGNTYTAVSLSITNGTGDVVAPAFELWFGVVGQSRRGFSNIDSGCPETDTTSAILEPMESEETRMVTVCWEVPDNDIGSLILYLGVPGSPDDFTFFALDDSPVLPFDDAGSASPEAVIADASPAASRTDSLDDMAVVVIGYDTDAAGRLSLTNPGATPPAEGYRYHLVHLSVTNLSRQVVVPGRLTYTLTTSDGQRFDPFRDQCGSLPDSVFQQPILFPGGSTSFDLCWSVPVDTPLDTDLEISVEGASPIVIAVPID